MKAMDREWREAADLRPSHVGLALALAAAALLRFWTLGHGVPYVLGVDEPEVMDRAVRMVQTGDFNPHFFDYPSLYMYVQAAVVVARFLFGAVRGEWSSLAGVTDRPTSISGDAAVTAILGTASVFVLYMAGLRWGARTALLAAGLLAVMPLHVRESHFILTDVPMTFFVTLSFLLSLSAHERATLWPFVAAGVAVGLAAATKYTGALAILMPLIACWMTLSAQPSRLIVSLAILGGSLGAFLLAAPYTFLDLPTFLNQFARLAADYHHPLAGSQSAFVIYLKHLRNAWHWPATLMIVGGLILGLVRTIRGPGRVKWTLLLDVSALLSLVHLAPEHRLRQIPAADCAVRLLDGRGGGGLGRQPAAAVRNSASGEKRADRGARAPRGSAPLVYVGIVRYRRRQGLDQSTGLRVDSAGGAARLEDHHREPRTAPACGLSSRSREATAIRSTGGLRGRRNDISDRLLAGLRAVPREPTELSRRDTATTSDCFERLGRSRVSRRRRIILVRSCGF